MGNWRDGSYYVPGLDNSQEKRTGIPEADRLLSLAGC